MSEPHKLIRAFNLQAFYCRDLGSPFMGDACELFAANLTPATKVGQTLFDWPGQVDAGSASLPLRLMGCLHRLVISRESPELAAIYPPNDLPENAWQVFERALIAHEGAILHQLQQAPQTNEVRRSGILLPGFMEISAQTGTMPFVMSEFGASAGLNLNWLQYSYQIGSQNWGNPASPVKLTPEWSGPELILDDLCVADIAGCDLAPIDLGDVNTTETLLSYLWADQVERLERAKAAIDLTAKHPVHVEKSGAIDWLKKRLATIHDNHVHVIYHTIARQYFSDADKRESEALLEAAGAKATKSAPLAWLRFEADGQKPGAALTLRVWPSGEEQFLGRADYHGRWIDWAG